MNTSRENMIWRRRVEWLNKHAPKMPLVEAIRDADEIILAEKDRIASENALLVLLIDVLGVDDHDSMTDAALVEKINKNPRTIQAYRRALTLHAGVACSPFSGGIKDFLMECDGEAEDWMKKNGSIVDQKIIAR